VRLEKIADEFRESCVVEWKSFLLRPYPEERSLEAFRRYTESWLRPAAEPESGSFTVWSTEEAPPSHSVPPAVAAKAAARQGPEAFGRYHRAVMESYFHQNRNIAEQTVLVRIARETGLDVAAFVEALRDPTLGREVVDDHNQAVSMGISGVPTVIVDGRWKIAGAQPRELYRRIMELRLAGEPLA
jgi:predicted DsbA family dithiol-disulfide isomerase